MPGLLSSKPSYSGLHLPWECMAPFRSPRYVTSQSTGQGHTRVRSMMLCGSDIKRQQPSPCPKSRDIPLPEFTYPALATLFNILVLMPRPSVFMQFPEPIPNFELSPTLPPTLPGAMRTPSQMSGTLSWNSQGYPLQYFHRVGIYH